MKAELTHPACILALLEDEFSDPISWKDIDQFIEDTLDTRGFSYLIILGPPKVVPFCTVSDPAKKNALMHTDFHYAETTSDDYQDLSAGRILGASIDDMMRQLEPQSLGDNALVTACWEAIPCGEGISDILTDKGGMNVVELFGQPIGGKLNRENFKKELPNKGIIYHTGHANPREFGCDRIRPQTVLSYKDVVNVGLGSTTPLVFGLGCYSAELNFYKTTTDPLCLATAFIAKGARFYYGSTEESYGGSLPHWWAWQDKLGKYFVEHLVAGQDAGTALKNAKRDYVDKDLNDFWNDPWGYDRKTLWEFVLYGDPLLNPVFPKELTESKASSKIASSTRVLMDIPEYDHRTVNGFDIIEISGTELHVERGYPIIPMITKKYTIPADEELTAVNLIDAYGQNLPGTFKLPIGQAWSAVQSIPETELYITGNYPGKLYKMSVYQETDGSKTLVLTVAPLQYNPKTGQVFLYRHIELEIVAEPSTLDVTPPNWEIESILPKESALQTFSIKNSGTLPISEVDIAAKGEIQNWVTFNTTKIEELYSGESTGLEACITIPEEASFGFYSGYITLTSNLGSQSIPVFVRTQARKGVMAEYIKLEIQWLKDEVAGSGVDPRFKRLANCYLQIALQEMDKAIENIENGLEIQANCHLSRAIIYVRRFSSLIDSYRRLPPLLAEEWKQKAERIVEAITRAIDTPI